MFAKRQLAEEFFKLKKLPHPCWELNPRPPAYEATAFTIILTWQMRVNGIKVCAEQIMPNQLLLAENSANLEKSMGTKFHIKSWKETYGFVMEYDKIKRKDDASWRTHPFFLPVFLSL